MEPKCSLQELGTKTLSLLHTYADPLKKAPEKELVELQDKDLHLKKELRNAQRREMKAKETVKSLRRDLAARNLINVERELKLASFDGIPFELFCKPSMQYSQKQREFALTLHLYSPKAYSYLRMDVRLNLPEPRTLRSCCLMLDAMAIKKQVEFDPRTQKFTGFINLGWTEEDDSTQEAKEVLVFMLVGLQGRWKAPVAYFLHRDYRLVFRPASSSTVLQP